MNITLLKKSGTKEVINHLTLDGLVAAIKEGEVQTAVKKFREVYHLMKVERLDDGQVTTNWEGGVRMPRICFAADYQKRKEQWLMKHYNGLVVLEVNNLPTYEKAVEIRGLAKKLPETLMCFLGASGRSVKIVCRGELYSGGLPEDEAEMRQFHLNIYNTARRAYQNQFGFDIPFLEPRLDRTVYMSADPEMSRVASACRDQS